VARLPGRCQTSRDALKLQMVWHAVSRRSSELPLDAQVKLLRVLQEGELPKVGASSPIRVDIRVVAATHRNLSAMIEDGTSGKTSTTSRLLCPCKIPALRERREVYRS